MMDIFPIIHKYILLYSLHNNSFHFGMGYLGGLNLNKTEPKIKMCLDTSFPEISLKNSILINYPFYISAWIYHQIHTNI